MFSFWRHPAARRHICSALLAYCRFCEPAVVLLGRVGAARGRRPDRDPRRTRPGGAGRGRRRLSVVVDRLWRAEGLAEMIAEAGLQPEIARTDENTPLVRTTADPRLVAIARDWTLGAVKTVPPQWLPGPRELRAWTLAAGTPEADRYLLGLDPHAPDSHARAGVGDDAGGDSPDVDRHQRVAPGAADQRATTAIAPGRERGGTPRQRRGV